MVLRRVVLFLIGFHYFSFNLGDFLKFWGILEIQDGGSRVTAMWKL